MLVPVGVHGQGTTEIVRGQVIDLQQRPVADATVTVTSAVSRLLRIAHTDHDGRYTVLFLEGDGTYLILVRKIGYSPALRRVSRGGLSNIVEGDAVLAANAYPLDPITVTTPRVLSPSRTERASIGGASQDLLSGAAFLIDRGDLNELMALLPGMFAGDGGVSALGTSPDQNSTLLDGGPFNGGRLPPDAICGASVATTTSDPSRGNFAGAQTSVTSCRGRDFFESSLRGYLMDPALSWSDAASISPPSRIGTTTGYLRGPLRKGVAHYSLSFSGSARASDAPSLLAPRSALLPQLGLAADSIAAVTAALGALRVPLTDDDIPSTRQRQAGSAFLSVDWNPGATGSFLLSASGGFDRITGNGINQSAFPSIASRGSSSNGRVQFRGVTYWRGVIDELNTALDRSSVESTPVLALPGGSVRVGTLYSDGSSGVTTLGFGGSTGFNRTATTTWFAQNKVSWLLGNNLHQLTAGQEIRLNWNTSLQSSNRLGTYDYQSLADLATNRPASYTRTLNPLERSNQSATFALSLGDIWRAAKAISLEGGVRLDAAHFGTTPEYNPAVDAVFGRRTDHLASNMALSPRVGFAWLVHRSSERMVRRQGGQSIPMDIVDVNEFNPTTPRANVGAGVTLFGNVGAYHGVTPPDQVASLDERTGLPGAIRTLSCVGAAVPIPDWSADSGSVFDLCANGTAPASFSGNAPTVSLLDPNYRTLTDWKANLGLTGLYWRGWEASLSIIVKRGINYTSREDLNLNRSIGFQLANEAFRPVYVTPVNIVPQTGMIAPSANRVNAQFGAVMNTLSDLHADAVQFGATVWLPPVVGNLRLMLQYSYNRQRTEARGFNGTTAGNPFDVETFSGVQPVSQFILGTSHLRFWWFEAAARFNLTSGVAYTPTVVGDVNGDGLSNDRAYIVDASATVDTALAAQMNTLRALAPRSARACLQGQAGRIAATNSCRGPWQPRLDFTVNFAPPQGIGLGDRLHLTATFFNGGAALMRLLGVNSALAQGTLPPDGRLLFVTGFDPVAQRFVYRVNQTFGQPMNSGLGNHQYPPFQLQIGVEYRLGVPPTNPLLRSYGLGVDSKTPMTPARIVAALRTLIHDPIDTILVLEDSLALSRKQEDSLSTIRAAFESTADSLVRGAVAILVQRAAKLTDADFFAQATRLVEALGPSRSVVRDEAMAVLTREQEAKFQALRMSSRRGP